jgi:hypothetical protein
VATLMWRSLVSNFIQTPSVNERILPGLRYHFKGDCTPKHVGGEWRMPCPRRARQSTEQSRSTRPPDHAFGKPRHREDKPRHQHRHEQRGKLRGGFPRFCIATRE